MPGALARGTLVAFALLATARDATADEPKVEYADGPNACRALHLKNARELAAWEKQQPPIPYLYAQEPLVLGSPWGNFTDAVGSSLELLAATIIPHFGAQLRGETPAAVVSWPWSLPLGEAFTCSRKEGTFTIRDFRAHRVMLEPGLFSSTRGTGFFVRPGYRFLYHPSEWVVGAGAGIGTTVDVAGAHEPSARPSVSPEALVQFGHCCESSYFTLAFRYDHYFAGAVTNVFGGSLGYTFF